MQFADTKQQSADTYIYNLFTLTFYGMRKSEMLECLINYYTDGNKANFQPISGLSHKLLARGYRVIHLMQKLFMKNVKVYQQIGS